ncbi:MAG: 50S ribosomal protein L18 [Myxococcales bacterium]|nr:50S ribosomal protein L18 [Myxococcales bacterium]
MSRTLTKKTSKRTQLRLRRHKRVRRDVSGTSDRPRLSVFRSNRHIYVQVIDDTEGKTLVSTSTLAPDLAKSIEGDKKEAARAVGKHIAELCLKADIKKIVFDRGGFLYKGGRIKALAEAAREAGLEF